MPITFSGSGAGGLKLMGAGGGGSGAQGPQGDAGPQGPQGYQGVAGSNGAQGSSGAQGPQGNQGPAGSAGSNGSQGAQGSAGAQGPQGAAGSNGSQGTQGYQGSAGSQGSTGLGFVIAKVYNSEAERIAATGSDLPGDGEFALIAGSLSQSDPAYGNLYLYKTNGGWTYETDMSVQGIQGPQGNQGSQGSQGTQGSTGTQGAQGNQGTQGTQGSPANTSYDVSMFYSGTPGSGEVMMQHVAGRAFSLSSAINDIKAGCLVNPSGSADVKVSKKSGATTTSLTHLRFATDGTVSFRNSDNSGTFSGILTASFSVGDMVIINAPASADSTFADIYITLIGTVS